MEVEGIDKILSFDRRASNSASIQRRRFRRTTGTNQQTPGVRTMLLCTASSTAAAASVTVVLWLLALVVRLDGVAVGLDPRKLNDPHKLNNKLNKLYNLDNLDNPNDLDDRDVLRSQENSRSGEWEIADAKSMHVLHTIHHHHHNHDDHNDESDDHGIENTISGVAARRMLPGIKFRVSREGAVPLVAYLSHLFFTRGWWRTLVPAMLDGFSAPFLYAFSASNFTLRSLSHPHHWSIRIHHNTGIVAEFTNVDAVLDCHPHFIAPFAETTTALRLVIRNAKITANLLPVIDKHSNRLALSLVHFKIISLDEPPIQTLGHLDQVVFHLIRKSWPIFYKTLLARLSERIQHNVDHLLKRKSSESSFSVLQSFLHSIDDYTRRTLGFDLAFRKRVHVERPQARTRNGYVEIESNININLPYRLPMTHTEFVNAFRGPIRSWQDGLDVPAQERLESVRRLFRHPRRSKKPSRTRIDGSRPGWWSSLKRKWRNFWCRVWTRFCFKNTVQTSAEPLSSPLEISLPSKSDTFETPGTLLDDSDDEVFHDPHDAMDSSIPPSPFLNTVPPDFHPPAESPLKSTTTPSLSEDDVSHPHTPNGNHSRNVETTNFVPLPTTEKMKEAEQPLSQPSTFSVKTPDIEETRPRLYERDLSPRVSNQNEIESESESEREGESMWVKEVRDRLLVAIPDLLASGKIKLRDIEVVVE